MFKNSTYFIIICFVFLTSIDSYSQRQLNLEVDNDLYFDRDFYYSSGIFLSYISPDKQENDVLNHYKLGQLIYTPSMRYEPDPLRYDYPYSGYLFLELKRQKKLTDFSSYTLGGQIGITGDASLARSMQNLYHDIILNLPNLEWKSQMPQELQLNFVANYFNSIKIGNKIAFTNEIYSRLGTYQIMSGVKLGLLIGERNWYSHSDNIINNQSNKISLYVGTRQEYYFYDYKLEGSLFNDKAPLTMPINKYRNTLTLGLQTKINDLQILTSFNSMSKETDRQRTNRHPFLKISLNYKFK